ncbi:NifB/NifX family molybdenum-iron cluster-binding protein [Desulfocurvus sp.]|jgi:predicted Fe-Mo cluster-binding NifX family protein|uniref:NifB/NifX family molybdenum-iron cluster-binding protein n=1 Tax=Desulfocurvus sp. TaxID=2871698 RepID=UPI0025B83C8B|nr:NifB/NifX family molybdenum-iron cluster-binding protein [Desulfocurvus sp.]MCK9239689.1 dinitrogenase iron-molybdenum cofactor biosynthesis protein [Desulfocurvus sp.]
MPELIAVAAAGARPESPVEPVIGRADYFLFFDARGDFVRAQPNPHRDLEQGSGQSVARMLIDAGARAVLGGNVGPKAALALRGAGVSVSCPHEGPARDAVARFLAVERELPGA